MITLAVLGVLAPHPVAAFSFTIGHYYSTNFGSSTISEYDAEGVLIDSIDVPSEVADDLRGVAFGPDGLLYVTGKKGAGFAVLALDDTGTVQETYPAAVYVGGNISYGKIALDSSYLYVAGQDHLTRFERGDPGSGTSIYSNNQVFDADVLPNGNLLVASAYEIEEITHDGAVVRTLGDPSPENYSAIRGVEYEPIGEDIFVSHVGYTDFYYRVMRVDAATGVLEENVEFTYADDLFLDLAGQLVVGSRTQTPAFFTLDLGLVGPLGTDQQMFVTQLVPEPGSSAVQCVSLASLALVSLVSRKRRNSRAVREAAAPPRPRAAGQVAEEPSRMVVFPRLAHLAYRRSVTATDS